MRCFMLCLFAVLCIRGFTGYSITGVANTLQQDNLDRCNRLNQGAPVNQKENQKEKISAMDALDKVQQLYAVNFDKVYEEEDNYYYKLPKADYYLYNEGLDSKGELYLIHLYEFVIDEPETGIGHTVTYGWYSVDQMTGTVFNQLGEIIVE